MKMSTLVWVSKIKVSAPRIKNKICNILYSVLGILGLLLTVAEFLDEVFNNKIGFELLNNYFLVVCGVSLIAFVIKYWDKLEVKFKIEGTSDVCITLKVCDALANEGAIIIPTNSTFDTKMDDDFISETSLQGQFQIKFYNKSLNTLDVLLDNALKNESYTILTDRTNSKVKRYPIGTVAKISGENKRAYFLADSDINKYSTPVDVSAETIRISLVSLWDKINEIGNRETYSIPLIGTGRAGIKDATRDDILKETVLSFIAASREKKLTENLIVSIHPNDFKKINWDEIIEFTRYNCKYVNVQNKTEQIQSQGLNS